MTGKDAIRPQSAHVVNDVFTVCTVARRNRRKGHVYSATLANCVSQYDAIGGPSASALATSKLVRVNGCVLLRQGKPVLVICSLKRIIRPALP